MVSSVKRFGIALASSAAFLASQATAQGSGIDSFRTHPAPATTPAYISAGSVMEQAPRSRQPRALAVARAALDRGDFARAATVLDANVLRGHNPEAPYLSAVAQGGLGKYARARSLFEEALVREPDHVGARLGLALTDIQLGRRVEAATSLAIIERRRAACGGDCQDAAALDRAVKLIRQFLP